MIQSKYPPNNKKPFNISTLVKLQLYAFVLRFAMEGRLLFTQPNDNNWRKGRTIKLTPINALLVTNGKVRSTQFLRVLYGLEVYLVPRVFGIGYFSYSKLNENEMENPKLLCNNKPNFSRIYRLANSTDEKWICCQ